MIVWESNAVHNVQKGQWLPAGNKGETARPNHFTYAQKSISWWSVDDGLQERASWTYGALEQEIQRKIPVEMGCADRPKCAYFHFAA